MSIRGPDVSAYQGWTIQWKEVARAGASFAACKISEGSAYFDETCPTNWQGMKAAGLLRIAYHFARPDLGTHPADEARWFLAHLPELEPTDSVALDLEVPTIGAGAQDAWALGWLTAVEQAVGFRPLVYTGPWYAQGLARLSDARLGAYPLWNAAYQNAPAPPAYHPWQRVHLWQWTDHASYPSIGQVDESIWLAGTLDDLKKLGKPAPKAPPPKPPAMKHRQIDTPMHLRPAPRVDAMPLGRLLPELTCVVELPVPGGGPVEQNGWAHCRTSGDVIGWLKIENMHQIPADAVPYNP